MNKAHIQEQRVYRKDLVHTVPTEVAGTNSVPFTTQEDENKVEQDKEEVEPFSVKEQTHKELEELQTQQPAEVQINDHLPQVVHCFLSGCSRA